MSDRFGKYIVEGEVGRGGFGRVYRAFDTDMQRRIAIKEVISEGDPDLLSRFQAEASTTASLTHENIVTVYEYGQDKGRPYLVMEFLEGQTLQEVIASGNNLPLLEKVEIMRQIAEGLYYAHLHGVIHRDIKPGNVMVLPDNKVKIMDFGIARLVNSAGARKTREGDLIGAVLYMAPESFRKQEADTQTDIFAYGTVFYEFLTGEHPFQAGDVHSAVNRIIYDDPLPLGKKLPDCPYALELLVQGLVMKDREARYDDLGEVLFDTEPILRQLREERARSLARESEYLFELGDFDALHPRVKRILSLDPANHKALFWKDKIREGVNRQRADKKAQKGLEHMSASRFRDAVVCFEEAVHLGAANPEIASWLETARAAVKRMTRAAELLTHARIERQGGYLEKALATISQAVELDPANQDASRLKESLRREIRDIQTAMLVSECHSLRREGRYQEALSVLDALDQEVQKRSDIIAARDKLLEEMKEAERRKSWSELREQLQSGRRFLSQHLFEQATKIAAELCLTFPEEREVLEFRAEVERQFKDFERSKAIAAYTQSAQALLNTHRFEEAEVRLVNGLREFPGERSLRSLAETVKRAAVEHREVQEQYKRDLERVLQSGRQKIEAGRVNEAVDLLETVAFQYEHEETFKILLGKAREAVLQRERAKQSQEAEEHLRKEREQALVAAYKDISDFSRAGRFTAAHALLDQITERYGNSLGLQALRMELEGARERRTREGVIADVLARSAEAVSQQNFKLAMQILEESCDLYPGSDELRYERQRVLAQSKNLKKSSRDEDIATGIRNAIMLARAADFASAVNILAALSKRYPNSSEVRRNLEAATRELSYHQANSRPFTNQLPEKRGPDSAATMRDGKGSGALSWLKGFVNNKK